MKFKIRPFPVITATKKSNKAPTVNDMQEALTSINTISESIDNNISSLDGVSEEFEKDIDSLDKKQAGLEGWIEDDIARVENAIQLPDITIENVAKIILESFKEIFQRARRYKSEIF